MGQSRAEKALAKLQRLIIRPPKGNGETAVKTRQLPSELTGGKTQMIGLLADEVAALEAVKSELLEDLHFEHMRNADDDLWHFVGECWLDQKTDHVSDFISQHSQDPEERTCFMPVEYLSVTTPTEVLNVSLLPLDDSTIPQAVSLEKPIGCVAAVVVKGTNLGLMADRARTIGVHGLRVLRIALREHLGIHYRQLRFQLGTSYAFDEQLSGWRTRDDVAYELEIIDELIEMVRNQPISRMPVEPRTDVDTKADVALKWMEQAWLTGEPLVALLYLFFALEALLGDKSEGLKAHGLAFRQAMLSHIVEGHLTQINKIWFLYDEVRSGAVHGEDTPAVDWGVVQSFARSVRKTLNQYLILTEKEQLVRRGRLLKYLDGHQDRPLLIAWLRTNGGEIWTEYLDRLQEK